MKYASQLLALTLACIISAGLAHGQSKTRSKTSGPSATKGTKVSDQRSTSPSVAAATSDPTKCTGKSGLTGDEITELLAGHNRARSELKLAPLTWDCSLASYAQEWATRGVFEHRTTDFGENIFVASNSAAAISLVMNQWLGERQYWDNAKGACAPGKTCTHYTQTVWKMTTKVGCGVNRNATGKWKALVVCNYDPAGNSSGPAY